MGGAPSASASTSTASRPTGARRRSRPACARDFEGGMRAGVVTTPTVAIDGALHAGSAAVEAVQRLAR